MNRHLGTFKVSKIVIDDHPEEAAMIFKDVIPVRVEYIYHEDVFVYTGISKKHFVAVPEGQVIPKYTFIYSRNPGTLKLIGRWTQLEENEYDTSETL